MVSEEQQMQLLEAHDLTIVVGLPLSRSASPPHRVPAYRASDGQVAHRRPRNASSPWARAVRSARRGHRWPR